MRGCHRSTAALMARITVREEIVAPVITSTSEGSFPLFALTPTRGSAGPRNWRTKALSFSIRSPSPGVSLLPMTFMATDLVTSPITNRGRWIFAAGVGILVVVIRAWGGLPEGVMYAILLMNALVPFINRATQPRVFGTTSGRRT